jgi:hypothetical protein
LLELSSLIKTPLCNAVARAGGELVEGDLCRLPLLAMGGPLAKEGVNQTMKAASIDKAVPVHLIVKFG